MRAFGWVAAGLVVLARASGASGAQQGFMLVHQPSGSSALLQAVSAVDDSIVWVGGHGGTVLRTVDGGRTWEPRTVPDADSLEFRDVHAVSPTTAYFLSAGPGARSRIFKTVDGGTTWDLQFQNADSSAFYDCFAFWSADHGMAFSDPVGGAPVMLETSDGGVSWRPVPTSRLPVPLPDEAGFAASGTCLVTVGTRHGWIGTGGGSRARVLRTADRGQTWSAASVADFPAGPAAGIFTLAMRDTLHGMALGGNLNAPSEPSNNVAVTADGGATWTAGGHPTFSGVVYGASYLPGAGSSTVVAVGPNGASLSRDEGRTWTAISTQAHWAVHIVSRFGGWAVGPEGRITRILLY